MNAAAFAHADRLYRLSALEEVYYHYAAHSEFARFSVLARQLRRRLGESELAEDDNWAGFNRLVQAYRFDHSLAPLAFNDPSVSPRMSREEIMRWLGRTRTAFPDFSTLAEELAALISSLRNSNVSPLLDTLESITAENEGSAAVILRDARLVQPTRRALGSRRLTERTQVLSALGLRSVDGVFDRLFVVGSPRWYPEFIFSAARAPQLDVVAYAWQDDRWHAEPAFRASVAAPRRREVFAVREVFTVDRGSDEDDRPLDVDWSHLERQATTLLNDEHEVEDFSDIAEARLVLLPDDQAVFLEVGARRSLVIDLDEDDSSRVRRIDANEIDLGMFVLLRTEGGGDYIVPLADHYLRDRAAQLRAAQASWKSRLADLVRRRSLSRVATELAAIGCKRADEGNLRRWISARNIRTQDQTDFNAIMQLIGLSDEADALWHKMGIIQGAHQAAGRLIMSKLLDQVRRADLATLVQDGRMDFMLSGTGSGRLTAYRVEVVAPETTIVAASQLNRPFTPAG